MSLANFAYAAKILSSPPTTKLGVPTHVACTPPWLLHASRQIGSTAHESAPSHRGGDVGAVQSPWQSPLHAPPLDLHVPAHAPLHEIPLLASHPPVQLPLQMPPENFPVHDAEQLPLAFALHVPWHLPAQLPAAPPVVAVPSHVPLQVPTHDPLKLAVHPVSHVPVHVGASHVPSQTPAHDIAALAVHSPTHVPLHVAPSVESHSPLHPPLHPTTSDPGAQLAVMSHATLAAQSA